MGDTVNLAARVMGKAAWGEMVATQEVIDRATTDFELTALEPFMVKGKSAPIHGQAVGQPRGARVHYDEASLEIVGRSNELARMREALASAHHGEGRVIELVGPAGIGKSKLMSTVRSLDHGLDEFTVEAGRYSLATPYFALRRSLRRIVGALPEAPAEDVEKAVRRTVEWLAPDLTDWLPLLAGPLGIDIPETKETERLEPVNRPQMVHATVMALIERVMTGPTLITVEDAHWLDEASSEVVKQLSLGLTRKPWVVLITRRDVPSGLQLPDEVSATRIELQPLADDAAMAMAWKAAKDLALPPGTIDELVQRSGGNPLFLQELVRAASTGHLSELPETIEATIAATIDTLEPDDRSLLRHAAVLGSKFPIGILEAMFEVRPATLSVDLDRLDHFLVRDTVGDAVRFRHVLLRDVAYEGLSFRSRRALHERAGTILEDSAGDHPERVAELLSIHFHAAGRYRQSWIYSRIAGERARRNGAPVEAAAFFARALEDSRHIDVALSERAEAALQLGDISELGGRYEDADAAYRLARRLCKEPLQLAEVSQKIGLLREREGRFTAAIRWFGRGLKALGDDMSAEATRTRAVLVGTAGHSRVRQGRYLEAIKMLEEAATLAESSGERFALAYACQQLDLAHSELGKLSNCVYSPRALAIYEELGNERGKGEALNQMGITAYWEGRWDEAVNLYERSLEAQRRAGSLVDDAVGLNNIGEIRSDQGRIGEAEQLLTAALRVWTGAGLRHGIGWATSNLARAAARDRRLDEAEERFDVARHILSGVGAEGMLLETMARQVELAVFRGDPSTALGLARDVACRATKLGGMANVLTLIQRMESYALCQSGDCRTGWQRLIENLADCGQRGADYDAALALEALARIAPKVGEDGSEEFAAQAKAIFDRLGVIATPDVPLPD
jgi:tetratricopeptide (TPR) repeat protein